MKSVFPSCVVILISDKVDLKARSIARNKEGIS